MKELVLDQGQCAELQPAYSSVCSSVNPFFVHSTGYILLYTLLPCYDGKTNVIYICVR